MTSYFKLILSGLILSFAFLNGYQAVASSERDFFPDINKKRKSAQVESFPLSEQHASNKEHKSLSEAKVVSLEQRALRIQTAWQAAVEWEMIDPAKANPFYEAASQDYANLIAHLKNRVPVEDYLLSTGIN